MTQHYSNIFVQTMSILVVNQSVIDMCASFCIFMLTIDKKMTGMSPDSIYDHFVCRIWTRNKPLWCMLVTSTYGILLITLSRYIAVIYPMKYKQVRIIVKTFTVYSSVLMQLICESLYRDNLEMGRAFK